VNVKLKSKLINVVNKLCFRVDRQDELKCYRDWEPTWKLWNRVLATVYTFETSWLMSLTNSFISGLAGRVRLKYNKDWDPYKATLKLWNRVFAAVYTFETRVAFVWHANILKQTSSNHVIPFKRNAHIFHGFVSSSAPSWIWSWFRNQKMTHLTSIFLSVGLESN